MKLCNACGTIHPDHYQTCPSCGALDRKDYEHKYKYKEYDDISGDEIPLLMAVNGELDDVKLGG